jgi:hypothetical protein
MSLSPDSFITVENLAEEPFTYTFQRRQVIVQPHLPVPIPWEHMLRIAGDPFADETDRRNLRSDAVERLRSFYGIYSDEAAWQSRHPLKFTDEEGNVVPTPYTHPDDGAVASTDPADLSYLVSRMRANEQENAAMKLQIAQLEAAAAATSGSHLTADMPADADITPSLGPIPDPDAPPRPSTLDLPSTPPKRTKAAANPAPAPDPVTADSPTRVKTS